MSKKNLVRPLQVKLLVGFQPNLTGVISTIPSMHITGMFASLHKMATGPKIEKSRPALTG
jgi:hypothetical protein